MKPLSICVIGLAWILNSCSDESKSKSIASINGTWYYNSSLNKDEIDYTELHFSDSSFYPIGEKFGPGLNRKYKVMNDSIYYEEDGKFIPYYSIQAMRNDSLFLSSGSGDQKKEIAWVRLPKNEKGYYDHNWTASNVDSLNYQVKNDWSRRSVWYRCSINNQMAKYDSLLKADYWKTIVQPKKEEDQ